MNRDIGTLLRPIVALALLALVVVQTSVALRATGAWSKAGSGNAPGRNFTSAPPDPVAAVEAILARPGNAVPGLVRDPFQVGGAPAPVVQARPVVHTPVTPPPPPRPVLTAIVWDADPRALVRWKGRDWIVRPGGLFDDFQVTSITRDQVALSHGSETIVLQRKAQGD